MTAGVDKASWIDLGRVALSWSMNIYWNVSADPLTHPNGGLLAIVLTRIGIGDANGIPPTCDHSPSPGIVLSAISPRLSWPSPLWAKPSSHSIGSQSTLVILSTIHKLLASLDSESEALPTYGSDFLWFLPWSSYGKWGLLGSTQFHWNVYPHMPFQHWLLFEFESYCLGYPSFAIPA